MTTRTIHLAYADDHTAVRKGIISILGALGDIVVDIEANNGKDLIDQLASAPRLPDICMLDINMPVMNGFETLIEIRRRWPQIRVLAFTVFTIEHYVIRMIRNGASGYLLKDCDPKEIKQALISIDEKGVYYSSLASCYFQNAIRQNLIALPVFTEKEITLLKYACSDLTYSEIAEIMKTTSRSVEGYRDSLFKKLNVKSRVSLALYAVQSGLVPLDIVTAN